METTRSADGSTITFDRLGAGPPVVLLAGATCTRCVTAPLALALAEHLTVLNVDRRGRGDSDDRSGAPPWQLAREVEDVAAVVAAAGGTAAVYGHSSGAALALHAAAAGIGVDRLVMHDAPFAPPGGEERARAWDATLHALLREDRGDEAIAAFLDKVGVPAPVVEGMRHAPHWPAVIGVAPTLAYDSAAMGDRDGGLVPTALLAAVDVPALVLVGGDSPAFMLDVAEALAGGLPDARVAHLAGQGHDAAADVVAPHVVSFLTSRA
jgi:pimeloyl-ACP methyl ester carboxylesterase